MGRRQGSRLTIAEVREQLRPLGIVIKKNVEFNEYRVNFWKGDEATAYYTDHLDDALATGIAMAKHRREWAH